MYASLLRFGSFAAADVTVNEANEAQLEHGTRRERWRRAHERLPDERRTADAWRPLAFPFDVAAEMQQHAAAPLRMNAIITMSSTLRLVELSVNAHHPTTTIPAATSANGAICQNPSVCLSRNSSISVPTSPTRGSPTGCDARRRSHVECCRFHAHATMYVDRAARAALRGLSVMASPAARAGHRLRMARVRVYLTRFQLSDLGGQHE